MTACAPLTHTAFIGLGANLGHREETLLAALRALEAHDDIHVIAASSFIETEPVGGPAQPNYLNGAAALETSLAPHGLLMILQRIEADFGRERTVRWGPRTLDLDILLYENLILNTPELTVPHPRMHERAFVLVPLAQIAPDAIHPALNLTVEKMLEALDL